MQSPVGRQRKEEEIQASWNPACISWKGEDGLKFILFLLASEFGATYTEEAEPHVPPSTGLRLSVWVLWEADTEMVWTCRRFIGGTPVGERGRSQTRWPYEGEREEGVNKKSLRSQPKARNVQPGPSRVHDERRPSVESLIWRRGLHWILVTCSHWLGAAGRKCGLSGTQGWTHSAVAGAVDQLCSLKQGIWVARSHQHATAGWMRIQVSNERARFHN